MQSASALKLDRTGWVSLAKEEGITFGETRMIHPDGELLAEGAPVSHPRLLLAGIACRHKMLGDGRRAIVAFLVPGDFINSCFLKDHKADFGVTALSLCEVVEIPHLVERALEGGSADLRRALLRFDVMDRAIQRMWLANIGQCSAEKRLAHLLCEMHHRLAQVGLADERGFAFPMTQADLADALGLSQVHVNRVMQHLKELGLVRAANRIVQFPNLPMLEAFAEFNPAYLHPQRAPEPVPA